MEDEFKLLIDKLPVLFETLVNAGLKPWNNLGPLPQNGIYVFYENGRLIYVGRSNRMKDRIKEQIAVGPGLAITHFIEQRGCHP